MREPKPSLQRDKREQKVSAYFGAHPKTYPPERPPPLIPPSRGWTKANKGIFYKKQQIQYVIPKQELK